MPGLVWCADRLQLLESALEYLSKTGRDGNHQMMESVDLVVTSVVVVVAFSLDVGEFAVSEIPRSAEFVDHYSLHGWSETTLSR